MIRLLRRSRLLALALLLATPSLGGAWLQAAHPCPVDSPWLLEHEGSHGDHAQGGAEGCHCVGSCTGATVAVVTGAPLLSSAAVPTPVSPPRLSHGAPAPAVRPSDRLPPATAPPLV
jgi:hypothetical protein